MKKRTLFTAIGTLIGLALLIVPTVLGQSYSEDTANLNNLLKGCRPYIGRWTFNAYISLLLVLAIGALGAVAAILQKIDSKSRKVATIILGGAISILTVVNSTALKYDFRTYFNWAGAGRAIITEIEMEIARGYHPPNDQKARDEWFERIQEKIHRLQGIPLQTARLERGGPHFQMIQGLYAQARELKEPAWISSLPENRDFLYFVGVADNSDLTVAKEDSKTNAFSRAKDYFKLQYDIGSVKKPGLIDYEALSRFLADSGQVEDVFYRYDDANKRYRHYTLLRLNRKNAEVDVPIFKMQQKAYSYKDAVTVAPYSQIVLSDDYVRTIRSQDLSLDSAREVLSPELYDLFAAGSRLKESSTPLEAIPPLEHVISARPEFFPAVYELAEAYNAQKDTAKAAALFERASVLEPRQKKRDPEFYVRYGSFLLQQGRTQEAIEQMRKALQIAPDYLKVRQTLAFLEKIREP